MIGQLMASRYNSDPKYITFSDNVQDAAHRAGFFGARTYRFTFRTALQHYVQGQAEGHSLARVAADMPAYWQNRMDRESFAATFLPLNLPWRQEVDHLERHNHLPAKSDLGDLISRWLRFETEKKGRPPVAPTGETKVRVMMGNWRKQKDLTVHTRMAGIQGAKDLSPPYARNNHESAVSASIYHFVDYYSSDRSNKRGCGTLNRSDRC